MNKFGIERLELTKNYDDFSTFLEESRGTIYRKIVERYKDTMTPGKEIQTLVISARVNGRKFDTDYAITKDGYGILLTTIIPYFESIEDYETCAEVLRLCKKLEES
jgi:hypothetical protein